MSLLKIRIFFKKGLDRQISRRPAGQISWRLPLSNLDSAAPNIGDSLPRDLTWIGGFVPRTLSSIIVTRYAIVAWYVQSSEVKVVRDLISAAEVVADERAFIQLLQMMALDREDEQKELARSSSPHSAGTNGWENGSIEAFLEAAAAWAEATSRTTNLGAEASDAWRRAAMIVVAGAFYE